MLAWFVENVLRPVWVVNEHGELGIRILGVNCYYYKWETPLIYERHPGDDPLPKWRVAYKREFGETVISRYGYSRLTKRAPDGAVCPAHQTYFEEDGTCAIAGCKETRPAGKA